MSPPRYRALDGDEGELPLGMSRWVVVPRALARFDPELTLALHYDDAPEPADADPRLDFSAGAMLVAVERSNEHAELEPNLGPCHRAPTGGPGSCPPRRRPLRATGPRATTLAVPPASASPP